VVAKKNAEALVHCNEVSSLRQELELKKNDTMNIRTLCDEQTHKKENVASNLGQLYLAINNILERFETQPGNGKKTNKPTTFGGTLSSRHHGTTSKTSIGGDAGDGKSHDFPDALLVAMDSIAEYIEDYGSIVNEWESRSTEQS